MSLPGLINALVRLDRFDRADVEAFLQRQGVAAGEDEYYVTFRLPAILIDRNVTGEGIELREPRNAAESPTLLSMRIDGDCVTHDTVTAQYPALRLIDVPRGRSPEERITYEMVAGRTSVRFGFDQRSPACLVDLTVERRP